MSSGNRWLWPLFVAVLACPSCEPRVIEIEGLAELTSEVRSHRIANNTLNNGSRANAQPLHSEQVKAALAPLRDVLTQLAASQSELSGRQATLTQEMRRWTQLLVASMQSQHHDDAQKLSERLATLEQTIAQQDARHRQVEKLLGTALDHTADQLEGFLRRVGADLDTPNANGDAGNVTPSAAPATQGNKERNASSAAPPPTASKPAGSGGGTQNVTRQPAADDPGGDGKQASMRWLWWILASLSVASGLFLLRGRRRVNPVGMAPEMQVAPPAQVPAGVGPAGESLVANPHAQAPEVEELWAAAALLGQAIGRLKPNEPVDPPSNEPNPYVDLDRAAPGHQELDGHMSHDHEGVALDEIFVLDETETELAVPNLADAGPMEPSLDETHMAKEGEAPVRLPVDMSTDVLIPHGRDALPTSFAQPATRHASTAPVICRLQVRADAEAAIRLRSMLRSDPRVLLSPAPEVQAEMGELQVSFSLLPGLSAGERSVLEQQLRDTVA